MRIRPGRSNRKSSLLTWTAAVAVASTAALTAAASVTAHPGGTGGDGGLPQGADPVNVNPADFSANIDNRRWPMTVGSRWVYKVTETSRTGRPSAR